MDFFPIPFRIFHLWRIRAKMWRCLNWRGGSGWVLVSLFERLQRGQTGLKDLWRTTLFLCLMCCQGQKRFRRKDLPAGESSWVSEPTHSLLNKTFSRIKQQENLQLLHLKIVIKINNINLKYKIHRVGWLNFWGWCKSMWCFCWMWRGERGKGLWRSTGAICCSCCCETWKSCFLQVV